MKERTSEINDGLNLVGFTLKKENYVVCSLSFLKSPKVLNFEADPIT